MAIIIHPASIIIGILKIIINVSNFHIRTQGFKMSHFKMQKTIDHHYEKLSSKSFQIPTVGFNMRKISKGNVTIKLWDIGGQPRWSLMMVMVVVMVVMVVPFYHYCCCYCYCLLTFVINIGICRFRSMWERYCRGVNAIVYMVDAADQDKIEVPASSTP